MSFAEFRETFSMSLLVVMSLSTLTASQVSAGYFKRYFPSTACYLRTFSFIFTARCYASAVLAMGLCLCLSVCLSVCLCLSVSVTSRSSTKTVKRRITQTTQHDTPGSLVFWCQRSPRNSTGVIPYEGAECSWGGQNRRLSTNNRLYLENGKR